MSDKPRRRRVQLYDEPLPFAATVRSTTIRDTDGLSKMENLFCQRYTAHYEKNRAALEAGYPPARTHVIAHRLLQETRIKRRIVVIETDRLRRTKFDGDTFLARELLLATADVGELIETWIPPCRYCWGLNSEYQRTHAEFQEAWDEYMRLPEKRRRGIPAFADFGYGMVAVYDDTGGKLPFDQKGGDGYDPSQPPNPGCPNCRGRGHEHPERGSVPYIRIKDSRFLSDTGRALYAGIKVGPRGFEQLLHDQSAARARLMAMLGKFLDLRALDQQPLNGQAALTFSMGLKSSIADLISCDPQSLSDGQLDALLATHGVVIENDGSGGEGVGSVIDSGEAPPAGESEEPGDQ